MSVQKDSFVKFRVSEDPSADSQYAESTLDSPKMTRQGIQYTQITDPGGQFFVNLVTNDIDGVTPVEDPENIPTDSFLYGFNGSDFDRIRALSPADDNVEFEDLGAIVALAVPSLFNGTDSDRAREASADNLAAFSGLGAALNSSPGEWSINHTPAANTQATISRAAGGAGVRHVCKSITATLIGLAAAAEATVLVNLRDGATGAGTILWSARLLVQGTTGNETGIALSGLNIVGSAATAMTLEFSAAGGADTFESVAITGYDAS